ncbi:3-oxoacyl-ACP reductase FabG [Buchnera aphidicola]|uniref:3-oxoacyl-ACP reductase FabG n=1 Tax=Buchnera aphidicola TaxID=9 RepID=UPI0034645B18
MSTNKKIAIVTGANRGIGKTIIKKLSSKNIFVIGTSRSIQGKNIINKQLKNNGFGIILNINDTFKVSQNIKNIYTEFGKIDILINNAAINHDQLLINMNYKNWNNVLETNLTSVFYISQQVIKYMMKKKYGRIITLGSISGSIGNIGQINYATTKSGIIGFNKTLALEVAKYGITSNVIAPGFIDSGMTKNIHQKKKKKYLLSIPMGKFGKANDIAAAILFLSSEEASYITGQTLHINGGMYMN